MPALMSTATFQLPDLISKCPFPLKYHQHGNAIAAESDRWYEHGCSNFTEDKRRRLAGLAAGKLSAFVYNESDDAHLRCSCDFMNLIFHYGDLSDGLKSDGTEEVTDVVMRAFRFPHTYLPSQGRGKPQQAKEPDVSKLSRDLWLRCIQDAGPGFQARLLGNLGLFFDGRNRQAKHRDSGVVPTLEVYIDIRRDSSALKPLIDFLEYTLRIDLPHEVTDHPIMKLLKQCVNDYCTWSNDIYSFNKEQASGDTYNMVIILMKTRGLDLQSAVDYAGDMCLKVLDEFCEGKKRLPRWGPAIDRDVERYLRGLESWIVASLHWSFLSGRYFGTEGGKIKLTRTVKLLPPKGHAKAESNRS